MARKSRKQTAAPMPAPSLYVHVALYIRLSVEDNKKRGCSVENQKLVLNDFLSDKPDFVVYDTYIDNGATGTNFHRPGFQQMLSDIEECRRTYGTGRGCSLHYSPITSKQLSNIKYFHLLTLNIFVFLQLLIVLYP